MTVDVSIIVPVYNGEKTISDTLNSILKQTYQNYEILIVNDGSTDTTLQILEKFSVKDNRVKVFNQINGGVSRARNHGLRKSKGKYVCFLDSDDFYTEKFLEYMIKEIKKHNDDICYCGVNYYPESKKTKYKDRFTRKNVLINYIKGKIPVHTSTWMISNQLIKKKNIFFKENSSWGEDVEFFYKALASTNKVTFVPEYLTYYRNDHSDSQLSQLSFEQIDEDYNFIMRIVNNKNINYNNNIEQALINYRLSALLTNKLSRAIEKDFDLNKLKYYYKKYEHFLNNYEWTNGLMSLKVNFKKFKLKKQLMEKK